ncbi:MAG: hypothetical protein O2973_03245 [Gemmatimonadetes bacterium]|nr:hypothetical protein [Gemmatimonadota bacterium]
MNQHTLSVLLQDGPAGLHRASSLLRRGSVNVSSLTLAASGTPGVLQMTLTVDPGKAPTVARHLGSLVEVISVRDVTARMPAGAFVGSSTSWPETQSAAHPDALLAEHGAYLYRAQADGAPGDESR